MATEQELFEQLRAADAAGDTETAKKVADSIRGMRRQSYAPSNLVTKTLAGAAMVPLSMLKGAADTVGGVTQLAAHAVDPRIGTVVDEKLRELDSGYEQLRQAWDHNKEKPDFGRFIGSSIGPMKAAGAITQAAPAITKTSGLLGTLSRIPLGMTQGAVTAGMMPAHGGEEFWTEKGKQAITGGIVGGLAPLAMDVGRGTLNLGKELFAPMYEKGRDRLAQAYEYALMGKNPQTARAIIDRTAQGTQLEILPGSQVTVGEAVAHHPKIPKATGIAAHEEYLSKSESISPEWKALQEAKRNAKIHAIERWAKTPDALEKAIQDRSDAASLNYGAAVREKLYADDQFLRMMKSPHMQTAFKAADKIVDTQYASGSEPTKFLLGKANLQKGSSLPVRDLHKVKLSLDSMIREPQTYAIDKAEVEAIRGLRDKYVEWITNKSGSYEFAKQQYEKSSLPIDRMRAGQYLRGKLEDSLGKEQPKIFTNAVEDLPEMLEKATGFPYRRADQILTPSHMESIKQVTDELVRQATLRDMAKGTRLSGGISDQAYGVEGSPLPPFLSWKAAVGNKVLRLLGRDANELMKQSVESKYRDPLAYSKWMGDYIDSLPPEERRKAVIDALTRNAIAPLSAGLATRRQ